MAALLVIFFLVLGYKILESIFTGVSGGGSERGSNSGKILMNCSRCHGTGIRSDGDGCRRCSGRGQVFEEPW
jgi:DnaJ-class molecular chaperone